MSTTNLELSDNTLRIGNHFKCPANSVSCLKYRTSSFCVTNFKWLIASLILSPLIALITSASSAVSFFSDLSSSGSRRSSSWSSSSSSSIQSELEFLGVLGGVYFLVVLVLALRLLFFRELILSVHSLSGGILHEERYRYSFDREQLIKFITKANSVLNYMSMHKKEVK